MSASPPSSLYEFGPFRLDTSIPMLSHEGEPIPLPPKAMETLIALILRGGRVVSREELIEIIWPDAVVEENNLSVNVSILRKQLGERSGGQTYIETVPRRGYRFTAEVREPLAGHAEVPVSSVTGITFRRWRALLITLAIIIAAAASWAGLGWRGGQIQHASAAGRGQTAPASMTGGWAPVSLALLPFRSLAASDYSAERQTAAAELTDAVTARLRAPGTVHLTPPGAMLSANMKPLNFLITGRTLEADAVLSGVIFPGEPEEVYLRLHLVSIGGGEVLWAATFRHSRDDLPGLLNAIARGVEDGLGRLAGRQEYDQVARRHTASPEAWQHYLQGRFIWEQRHDVFAPFPLSFDEPAVSIHHFERALALDPGFALARVGLADHYKTTGLTPDSARRAVELATEAVAIDPMLAEAHATLGFIRMFHHWDWAGAEGYFRRALELDPGCVTARQWYALFHSLRGNDGEAIQQIMLARELAPYSLIILLDAAEMRYHARRNMYSSYAIAARSARHARTLQPGSAAARDLLMRAYWMDGNLEPAAALYGWKTDPEAFARDKAGPRRGSAGFDAIPPRDTYFRAQWHAWLNQREEALELLERAHRERHFFIIYLEADPFFDTLSEEPRFQELLQKVGLGESREEPAVRPALEEAA